MVPPCSDSLLNVTGSWSICHCPLSMAAWLSLGKIPRYGCWRQRCPIVVARVNSRDASSAPTFWDKPRGVEDLPHVSSLELICRILFQGFYNRLHELQVRYSAWCLDEKLICSSGPCFNLQLYTFLQNFFLWLLQECI